VTFVAAHALKLRAFLKCGIFTLLEAFGRLEELVGDEELRSLGEASAPALAVDSTMIGWLEHCRRALGS